MCIVAGEIDTASAVVLSDFIKRGVDNFPAEKYGLVMWNHGESWLAFGHDSEPEPVTFMTSVEIEVHACLYECLCTLSMYTCEYTR